MGREEVVALFERSELFECQRIHLAQRVQVPLRFFGTGLLGGAVVREGGRGHDDLSAFLGLFVLGDLEIGRRQGDIGTVLGDQVVGTDGEVGHDLLFELFDSHRHLGLGHLIAVHRVPQCRQLGPDLRRGLLGNIESLRSRRSFGFQPVAMGLSLRHSDVEPRGDQFSLFENHLGHVGGMAPGTILAFGPRPRLPFGTGGAAQRIRFASHRRQSLLGTAQRQSRFHLHRAGRRDRSRSHVAVAVRKVVALADSTVVAREPQPLLRLGEFGHGLGSALFCLGTLTDEAGRLFLGCPRGLTEPGELLVDRTELGVGFMQSCQRLFSRFTAVGLLCQGAGQCRHQFLAAPLGALEFGGGRIDRRLHLDGRRPVAGTATAPAGADEVAVGGDHPE